MLVLTMPVASRAQLDSTAERAEFFELKIRPVLHARCVKCHGPDKASSRLRVDSRQALLKGGRRGPAIVPGHPRKSVLLWAILQKNDDLKMPPDRKLPDTVADDFVTWLSDGAVWPTESSPALVNTSGGDRDGLADTEHWSFQRLKQTEPPDDLNGSAEHPLDRFIAAKLRAEGLSRGRPADKRTLARRVSYDLIGLPPSLDEMSRFLTDSSPAAFNRLIDRLLASPRYGERWGRHWLDVARYADTVGNNADYPIPEARLYRDYVIDSFARDRPYDQFIQQQLAGDILAPTQPRDEYSEHVIATGFVALSRQFGNYRYEDPHLVIEDTIDTIGRGVLGLTLRCARCHDHKFDPISTRDYYGLYGIFASTQYPFAGSEAAPFADRLIPLAPEPQLEASTEPQHQKIADMRARIDALERDSEEARKFREWKTKADELLQKIHDWEREDRDTTQLRDELSRIDLYAAESYLVSKTKPLKREVDRLERLAGITKAFAVGEAHPGGDHFDVAEIDFGAEAPKLVHDKHATRAQAANARVQTGGDPTRWGEIVPRGFPSVLSTNDAPPIPDTQSGRLQLARWLTCPNTPAGSLTARVMVNRIWQWHFGKGLVATPSNFGYQGATPTHPDLLEWLAGRFVASDWSIKHMHRLILSSRTYQLASDDEPLNARDAANRWYWRFDRRRLDAESIRDAMLAVSGNLNLSRPGPHPFPDRSQFNYTQHNPFQAVYPSQHRSVFLMTQRFARHPFLALFDAPDTNTTTPLRRVTIVPLQALYMMNNEFVSRQSDGLARLLINASKDPRKRIDLAHRRVWSRPATSDEVEKCLAYIDQYARAVAAQTGADEDMAEPVDAELKAWTSFSRIMLTANEFVYVD